jgi:FkbM family methyltransferase
VTDKAKPLLKVAALIARYTPGSFKRLPYRLGPLTRWIRTALNRAAPQGLTEVDVAAGALAGARLSLDLQEEKDYWLGTYEPGMQAAIAHWIKPGTIAYDVGANIGYISLMLARAVGERGKVIAFEALPANVERLRRNLSLNPDGARVTVVQAAVCDRSGGAQFLVGPSDGMGKAAGSAGRQEGFNERISVPGITLDDFVFAQGNAAPQVIKMDIEGGEVLALPSMRRLLREARPTIMLEVHGSESAHAVWDELTAAGYLIRRMAAGYPVIHSVDGMDWKAYIVAIPHHDRADERLPGSSGGVSGT